MSQVVHQQEVKAGRGSEHKRRIIRLLRILEKESDSTHRFSTKELIERLYPQKGGANPCDSRNNQRNVCNDIKILREAGYPIVTVRHKKPEHYLGRRRFSPEELRTLIDIVQSSRSISEERSNELVESIKSLGSDAEAEDIQKAIRLYNRVKMENPELFSNISKIQKALTDRKQIQFRYFHYNFEFERVYDTAENGGQFLRETPLLITYVEDNYYAITYSTEKRHEPSDGIVTRRIDRMVNLNVDPADRVWRKELQDFDIDEQALFGMFHGEKANVKLTVRERAMSTLVDRFGHDMKVEIREDDETEKGQKERVADITVEVVKSIQFDGWIKGLGDLVIRVDDKPVDEYFAASSDQK